MIKNISTNFEKKVYEKFYLLVRTTCIRRLHQKESIDDAIQSTFLLYIRDQMNIKSNLSSWFYWASVNVCKVINNDSKKNPNDSLEVEYIDEVEHTSKNDICLDNMLASLPKKKREVLLMKYYDNMSNKEIAEKTKSKEASVKKVIERTISLLQTKFKKKDVLVTALFAQLFHVNKVSSATLNSSGFILQNSLIQQSIVKGVFKMMWLTKVKLMMTLMVCFTFPLSIFILAESDIEKSTPKLKNVFSYLKIRLTDRKSKKPIINKDVKVKVSIFDTEQYKVNLKVDGKGLLEIPFYKKGYYRVNIAVEDYLSYPSIHQSILTKENAEKEISLEGSGKIFVTGIDNMGGKISALSIFSKKNSLIINSTYDPVNNCHIFSGLKLGDDKVSISSENYVTLENQSVTIEKDKVFRLNVEMKKSELFSFKILNSQKIPKTLQITLRTYPLKFINKKGRQTTSFNKIDKTHNCIERVKANKKNLYVVKKRYENIEKAYIKADGFKSQTIKIYPDELYYEIILELSDSAETEKEEIHGGVLKGLLNMDEVLFIELKLYSNNYKTKPFVSRTLILEKSGQFKFKNLPAGKYKLWVSKFMKIGNVLPMGYKGPVIIKKDQITNVTDKNIGARAKRF
ncbi:MAG: hypothetical protein COA79_23755 [Planctomycetota bacterium]|nr:MAG: hypothetical protein COA79_23755 [Planctomycetota bacterium]